MARNLAPPPEPDSALNEQMFFGSFFKKEQLAFFYQQARGLPRTRRHIESLRPTTTGRIAATTGGIG